MSQLRPRVLGVEFTPGTRDELLGQIRTHLQAASGIMHVATANPEYVMTARTDAGFVHSINTSGVVTVDGAGLAIAVRLLHPGFEIERYTGVMLTPDMLQLSATTGAGVFLLGAGPGVAEAAGHHLLTVHPDAKIVGSWADGSPRPEQDAETLQRIADSGAKILLVAYGAPAQICWIQRNLAELDAAGVRIVAGIGGAFDYISGNVQLAPAFVRKLGLEWLYRLVREPWRWRRQLVLPHFAVLVLVAFVRSKLRGGVE